jgi:hypothetical protein
MVNLVLIEIRKMEKKGWYFLVEKMKKKVKNIISFIFLMEMKSLK